MTLYAMALDTGGTKSFALIADLHKRVIAEAHFDGLGVAHDDACAALQPLEDAMERILREAALRAEEIGCVVVNLGGKNEQQMRSALHRIFPAAHVEVHRESSGVLAEQIGRAHGADAVLLAGTGAIAISYSSKGRFIADGWGANMGDRGSGYWIGERALQIALCALEERQPLSHFASMVTGRETPFTAQETGSALMCARDKVRERLFPLARERVAAWCKTAAKYALEGDTALAALFAEAGRAMAETVERALCAVGLPDGVPLAIGGLTNCAGLWQPAFEKRLGRALRIGGANLAYGALERAVDWQRRDDGCGNSRRD